MIKFIRRRLKGWKTILANVLAIILAVFSLPEFGGVIPAAYMPYYVLGLALINMLLRAVTNTAVGEKR